MKQRIARTKFPNKNICNLFKFKINLNIYIIIYLHSQIFIYKYSSF